MRDLTFRIKSKDHSEWLHFTIGKILPNGDIFTLGQFTGLRDKHGVAIYEGDIVRKQIYEGYFGNCRVSFDRGAFICRHAPDDSTYWRRYSIDERDIEVVGNIYDNPELVSK